MKIAIVQLTDKCNLHCRSCAPPNKTHADIGRLMESIAKTKANIVSITGGEPTIHPQFIEFVSALAKKHIVHVATNGQNPDPLLVTQPNLISVSLDSHKPMYHDRHRGKDGAWQKAFDTLNELRNDGLQAYPCLLLAEFNYLEILDICSWFNYRGFRLAVCYPDNASYIFSQKSVIEKYQLERALKNIIWQYPYRKWMNSKRYFNYALKYITGLVWELPVCPAGILVNYIDVNGEIWDCFKHKKRPKTCNDCYIECFREVNMSDPEHERDILANFYSEDKTCQRRS